MSLADCKQSIGCTQGGIQMIHGGETQLLAIINAFSVFGVCPHIIGSVRPQVNHTDGIIAEALSMGVNKVGDIRLLACAPTRTTLGHLGTTVVRHMTKA